MIDLQEKQRKYEGFKEAIAKLLIWNTVDLFKPFKTYETALIQNFIFIKDWGAHFKWIFQK